MELTFDTNVRRASHLQRDYRTVLDAAKLAIVGVLDKDDTMLGIGRMDAIVFDHSVVEALEQVGQFEAAYARHRDEPVAEWVQMTPFPWLATLSMDDVREFRDELLPHLLVAVHQRNLETHLGNLRAWESTAETIDDRAMISMMMMEIDPSRLDEIHPPELDDGELDGDDEGAAIAAA